MIEFNKILGITLILLNVCAYAASQNLQQYNVADDAAIKAWIEKGTVPQNALTRDLTWNEIKQLATNKRIPSCFELNMNLFGGDPTLTKEENTAYQALYYIGVYYAKGRFEKIKRFLYSLRCRWSRKQAQYTPASWINILNKQSKFTGKKSQYDWLMNAYENQTKT
jgi:hypothetical protein